MLRRLALTGALLVLGVLAAVPAGSRAATDQVAMIQDTRVAIDPSDVVAEFARLGAQQVRVFLPWYYLAPHSDSRRRPARFNGADPAAYPAAAWTAWDRAIEAVQGQGMRVNLDVGGGAPLWATGPGMPTGVHLSWEPNAREYRAFVHAVGERYSGDYDPRTDRLDPGNPDDLPRIDFWSIWNEPNYGPSLAPQGLPSDVAIDHAPEMYRQLLDAAWTALGQTGHRHDTILFGELAPRGFLGTGRPHFGLFSGMKPLPFLRSMYCLDGAYRPLRGSAAGIRGCPGTAAGRRGFRRAHPAMFAASGFAIHPYSRWHPPDLEAPNDPDYASLADAGQLTRALDRVQRVYGSRLRLPVWNTEYGYLTTPPKHPTRRIPVISPDTAAKFLNQAEYISWRNPRIRSFMQYLLFDDPHQPTAANDWGGFATGLVAWDGRDKPTLNAWRLPVWMPITTGRRGARLEIWGCARPASFALRTVPDDVEVVAVRFRPQGSTVFRTLTLLPITSPRGYFDARVAIPGSGTIRLGWRYPLDDPSLDAGTLVSSRDVRVTLH